MMGRLMLQLAAINLAMGLFPKETPRAVANGPRA